MAWTIYCHTHIATGRRYVGQTKLTMGQRWRAHVRAAKAGGSAFLRAIAKHGPEAFAHEILETCESVEGANRAEGAWIERLRTRDPRRGFNVLPGGREGNHRDAAEVRRRMSRAARARWEDPAKRQAAAASVRTAEARARHSAAARAQWADPEVAARNRAAIEAARTPEVWARIRASQAVVRATPEHRARMSAIASSPEARARRAALRARPCKHCGGPRVRLANGRMRCRLCHAAGERRRLALPA